MTLATLAARNILRNRFRTVATIVGVAVTIVVFILLRTVLTSWNTAVDYAARDRLAVRNKMSWVVLLPLKYAQEVRERFRDDVAEVTWANWFGGKYAKAEKDFFPTLAVEPATMTAVYDDMVLADDQKAAWLSDRTGAVVGDALAKRYGWEIGDKITLIGTIFPRPDDWTFTLRGIYTARRKSVDRTQFLFHWTYLNDALPAGFKDQIGWLVVKVRDPNRGAQVSKAIDAAFEDSDFQTMTQSELELNRSFMAVFSAVLTAMDVVSLVILVIMVLILGNTIAMGARERTHEHGVLRAIGFQPRHLALFVLGEAMTIGLLGGGLGLLFALPFVNLGLGRWLEENMAGFFPYFQVAPTTAVLSMVLALGLALVAAAIPAYRAARLVVTDALRRIG